MWDDSLPSYDGSFEHNIIVLTLYLRVLLYKLVYILGALTLLVLILSPIVALYFGFNSIKIKIKEHKHHKKIKHKKQKKEEIDQNLYINQLKRSSKKYKKKH